MLQFDENGNLKPYRFIEVSLGEMESFFVESMPFSNTRHSIFQNYLEYISALQTLAGIPFFQLINGSFTTRKTNPEDLDVVTFLDFKKIEVLGKQLDDFKMSSRFRGIDGYFEKIYPENHPFSIRYRSDLAYWINFFSRNRSKQPKGFLKINFEQ